MDALTGLSRFDNTTCAPTLCDAVPKRLDLLHELVPKAKRVAVLINPSNSSGCAGGIIGLPIDILKASTSREIESGFATIVCEQIEALLISGDEFLTIRSVQIATLATRHGIVRHPPSAILSKLAA